MSEINHSEMVRALVKSGTVMQSEINNREQCVILSVMRLCTRATALWKRQTNILATPLDFHMLHMTMGIIGETGELLDAVKKSSIYRKPLDRVNAVEELGDLEFFIQGYDQGREINMDFPSTEKLHSSMDSVYSWLGITREEAIRGNIEKLAMRYENFKYSDASAQNRADKI